MKHFSLHGFEAFIIDQLLINISTDHPTDDAWHSYCEWAVATCGAPGTVRGCFVWAPHHGPSAEHRRIIAAADKTGVMEAIRRVGIVTDSIRVRGALVALGWLKPLHQAELRGFAIAQPLKALHWLSEVARFDRVLVEREVLEPLNLTGSLTKGARAAIRNRTGTP